MHHILESTSESLHRSNFSVPADAEFSTKQIVDFLVEHDLIETEDDEDIFFLTPEAYIKEKDDLYFHVYSILDPINFLEEPEVIDFSEEEINKMEETFQKRQHSKKTSRLISSLFLLLLMLSLVVKYSYKSKVPSNEELKEKLQLHLDEELKEKLQHISDSLIQNYQEDENN